MKLYALLLAFVFAIASVALCQQNDDAELKSIQKEISRAEKLTKDKAVREELKRMRLQLDRVRELWAAKALPNAFGLLSEVRKTILKHGNAEPRELQQNLRAVMKRIWPFLLKTGRYKTQTENRSGVTFLRLFFPEGYYTVTFPEDATPGETVSGRIQANPPQSASLYMMTFLGSPVVGDGALRKWNLPETFDFVMSDAWGNELLRMRHGLRGVISEASMATDPNLPNEKQPREAKPNIEIPHLLFQISSHTKAGGHLVVKGPFDGDFSNTTVGIGKYQGFIVAESPGKLVVLTHPEMKGEWTILIKEDGNWARCKVSLHPKDIDPLTTLKPCTPPAR